MKNRTRNKLNSYPQEILDGFRAVERSDGNWAIELVKGEYLHWIEIADDTPVRVSDPDMTMQHWPFREQAEGIIEWLRRRWNPNPDVTADSCETIKVKVVISGTGEE